MLIVQHVHEHFKRSLFIILEYCVVSKCSCSWPLINIITEVSSEHHCSCCLNIYYIFSLCIVGYMLRPKRF